MRLNYKKVGGTLSLDEYNALCYLLEQQGWFETIQLQKDTPFEGKFGNYILEDPYNVLTENSNGFTILRSDKPFYIKYNSDFECQYKIMFDVEESVTKNVKVFSGQHKGEQIPTIMYPNEKFDSLHDNDDLTQTPPEKETKKVNQPINRYYDTVDPYLDNQSVIIQKDIPILREQEYIGSNGTIRVYPSKYGYKKGNFIRLEATIQLDYTEPELNITDGTYDDPKEILCSNFDELKTVIDTAPPKSITYIRLIGDTYKFTDQIYIENKTVHIRGGNLDFDEKPYTILDAEYNCRHFYIDSRSTVTIENCYLINGNAYGNQSRNYLHHRGGSIYVGSLYELFGGDYIHLKTVFKAKNCRFVRNIAEFGGAVFNHNSRVELDSCMFYQNMCMYEKYHDPNDFYNCDFDYKLWNWGGAIRSESVEGYYYGEHYDRLHIEPSRYSIRTVKHDDNSDTYITYIDLVFKELQNTSLLSRVKLTTDNFKLIDIEDNLNPIEYELNSIQKRRKNINGVNTEYYAIAIHKPINYDHKYVFYYHSGDTTYDMLTKRLVTDIIVETSSTTETEKVMKDTGKVDSKNKPILEQDTSVNVDKTTTTETSTLNGVKTEITTSRETVKGLTTIKRDIRKEKLVFREVETI